MSSCAELELIINDQDLIETARDKLRRLMTILKIKKLDPERLERMFAYYNEHWPEYYGTEKIFVIE